MASVVSIYNMALSALGEFNFVSDPDEDSIQAKNCSQHYATARDGVLEDFDWPFARKVVALAESGTPPDDWAYQYAYPADCVKARRILNSDRQGDRIPFQIGLGASGSSKVIHTDAYQAKLRYTARVEDVTVFPPSFVYALAFRLAWHISIPITRDEKIAATMEKSYFAVLNQAKAVARNEGVRDAPRDAEWIRGR